MKNENYQHGQKAWNTSQCKPPGDYHDIYLKTDVLLLAVCLENSETALL